MSVLAGFDLVIEVSQPTILSLLKAEIPFPAHIVIPINEEFAGLSVKGGAEIPVTDLQLEFLREDKLKVTLGFSGARLFLVDPVAEPAPEPVSIPMGPLDGSVTMTGSICLVDGTAPGRRALGLDARAATAAIAFTGDLAPSTPHDSVDIVAEALAKFAIPIPYGLFVTVISSLMTSWIQSAELQTDLIDTQEPGLFKLASLAEFTVEPGKDGTLSPTARLEDLELHCISAAEPGQQALALFGTLLVANHGKGDFAGKTETAIPADSDGCVSLSADAFHNLIFCPSAAEVLVASVASLPPSCADAVSIAVGEGIIARLADQFDEGGIRLDATFTIESACKVTASVGDPLSFVLTGTGLAARLSSNAPTVMISPLGCNPATGTEAQASNQLGHTLGHLVSGVEANVNETISVGRRLVAPLSVSLKEAVVTTECLMVSGILMVPS